MNNEPPKIAQFTVIKGKNIPNELYREGENFSTTISTNCTNAAMVEIKIINLRKVRSILNRPPSPNKNLSIIQFIGIVRPNTKTTATPNPKAVFTLLETARKEHMPRK